MLHRDKQAKTCCKGHTDRGVLARRRSGSHRKEFSPDHLSYSKGAKQPAVAEGEFYCLSRQHIQLNPELSYSIDTEDFDRTIAAAESAKREKNTEAFRRSLESACELYRGEFMSGIYDDWADERRAFYTEQFSRVMTAIAKLAFNEKRWTDALKFAQQL